MDHSQVVSNRADGPESYGGGVFAYDTVFAKYSTIDSNTAADVGGIFTMGGALVKNSTISRNAATGWNGGLFVTGDRVQSPLAMYDSTVSGNTAGNGTAGVR